MRPYMHELDKELKGRGEPQQQRTQTLHTQKQDKQKTNIQQTYNNKSAGWGNSVAVLRPNATKIISEWV